MSGSCHVATADVCDRISRKRRQSVVAGLVFLHPEKAVISEETMDGQIFSYGEYKDIRLRLAGRYQIDNAATVLEAVDALRRSGVPIPEDAVRKGFVKVTWPGRFQVLEKEPTVIADGAQNRDAARKTCGKCENLSDGQKDYRM